MTVTTTIVVIVIIIVAIIIVVVVIVVAVFVLHLVHIGCNSWAMVFRKYHKICHLDF